MKIYFATWLTDKSLGGSLSLYKADNRLASYHFLKEQNVTAEELIHYVDTGENKEKE